LVGCHHLSVKALFKVAFPFRVEWIGFSLDCCMPFDTN
jgi:hypothetical protein